MRFVNIFALIISLTVFSICSVYADPTSQSQPRVNDLNQALNRAYQIQQKLIRKKIAELMGVDPKNEDDVVVRVIENIKNRDALFVRGIFIPQKSPEIEAYAQLHISLEKARTGEGNRLKEISEEYDKLEIQARKAELSKVAAKIDILAFEYKSDPKSFSVERLYQLHEALERAVILIDVTKARLSLLRKEYNFNYSGGSALLTLMFQVAVLSNAFVHNHASLTTGDTWGAMPLFAVFVFINHKFKIADNAATKK